MLNLFFTSLTAFAQAADAAATAQQPPVWMQFVPFIIIIGVFYIFLIRPQARRQKETQAFLSALKTGDQVITQSGILGRVSGLNEQVVTLEIAPEVQIKVLRSQVLMSQSVLQAKKEGK
ncbi:preprotein translocase subunit YajC [Pseudobdellovibrio exovorus]|uniref:Sec translocon accessory complex subunit YajC n=1 Tax=Pseudobdellovibrio exovorus JSS TaxID=1184267 RepID=M4V8U6_9BACT|nr:preprotein translocase subunit YajC [Pseudobdellovibrio exovorus]AGH95638.1 preprotein translocase YajC subunit [Pseudobdellovibrio exovorus JSS]